MTRIHIGLLNSILELAHATSQDLDFAHQKAVNVSHSEETITETNLLDLRRHHPGVVTLRTFGKRAESKSPTYNSSLAIRCFIRLMDEMTIQTSDEARDGSQS